MSIKNYYKKKSYYEKNYYKKIIENYYKKIIIKNYYKKTVIKKIMKNNIKKLLLWKFFFPDTHNFFFDKTYNSGKPDNTRAKVNHK